MKHTDGQADYLSIVLCCMHFVQIAHSEV